jgi:SOS-response transcriptional repressor LexA
MLLATPRQLQILQFMHDYSVQYHCSPTFRELAQNFGFTSPNAAFRHLESLFKKGYLDRIVAGNGCHRGYRLTGFGLETLNAMKIPGNPPPQSESPKNSKG